jgi:hypothetical protein
MNEGKDLSTGGNVELVFSPQGGLEKTKFGVKEFSTNIEEIKNWFKAYKIDTIELWIQGAVKEGAVTRLLVSFEGGGGIKVTLKPRD